MIEDPDFLSEKQLYKSSSQNNNNHDAGHSHLNFNYHPMDSDDPHLKNLNYDHRPLSSIRNLNFFSVQNEKELKQRLEYLLRRKSHCATLGTQVLKRLVDENLFLHEIMNVLQLSQEMNQFVWQPFLQDNFQLQQYVGCHCCCDPNGFNFIQHETEEDDTTISSSEWNNTNNENLMEATTQHTLSIEPFLNLYIGISKLDYPCKKILTHTLFRNNSIGVNHPFLIIGCYKIEWNDSSLVKIKYDQFKARNSMMVYKFHVIRGTQQVQKALITIAKVCTFWNTYKKFSQLFCNCHHFINDLLRELNIESPFESSNQIVGNNSHSEDQFDKHSVFKYMLSKLKLAHEERYIVWSQDSSDDPTVELSQQQEWPELNDRIQWNEKEGEIILSGGEKQLVAFHNYLKSQQQHDKNRETNDSRQQLLVEHALTCVHSYLNGYQLRNQTVRKLDYSVLLESIKTARTSSNSAFIRNLELEYPLWNAYWKRSMFCSSAAVKVEDNHESIS